MQSRLVLVQLLIFALVLVPFTVCGAEDEEEEDDSEEEGRDFADPQELYERLVWCLEKKHLQQNKVIQFLKNFNHTATLHQNHYQLLAWKYATNTTKANAIPMNAKKVKNQSWRLMQAFKAQRLNTAGLSAVLQRRVKKIATTAICKKKSERKRLARLESTMTSIYAKAQVVLNDGTALTPGESGPEELFKKTHDYDKLAEIWKKWRDVSGKKLRGDYTRMVTLLNKGATENRYRDRGYYEWFTDFEDPKFNEKVMDMYEKFLPLYKELHAFVRHRLSLKYPGRFDPKGPIPAHLLGNLWAQQWHNIFELVKPFKGVGNTDVTATMKAEKWTVHRMFKTAENFFKSIGLFKMTKKFWAKSMFKNPHTRPVQCHASAWDFYTLDDFRIKMCTKVNQNHFTTIHHEMGHITYFMSYRYQPLSFRTGANSGFHEAIGDTIALSVSTDKHLHKIGLLKTLNPSKESDINALMLMALQKVAFLPFGLLVDTWRWKVFNQTITRANYNKGWWQLREQLQGLMPPVERTEKDFDPGAKFHITANVPYIRYFASFIMQFQFYETMCKISGHKGPLHQCDFYQSKKAGHALKSMLKLGASQPWPEAMQKLTGQREIRLNSLNKYFAPLKAWLKTQRRMKGYPIGWNSSR